MASPTNNPGNLQYDSFAVNHGATGYVIGEGGVQIAVFPDEATGYAALYAYIGPESNAAPSSFQNVKDLRFIFTLGTQDASFVDGQKMNTLTLQGLRASVNIDNAGGAYLGTLTAQIFGMNASHMNTLTSPQWDQNFFTSTGSTFGFNKIQVFAIDGAQETLVYNGEILNSWGVYTSMPDVYLYLQAQIGYAALVQPTGPLSIAANTDVATAMQQIATAMGYSFENNGVSAIVTKGTYKANTLMEQARSLMRDYRFWMSIDPTSPNTLVITPYATARNIAAPLISPQTGLIGYPLFNETGVNFETLFSPGITLLGPVNLQSSLPKANGTWLVTSCSHQLSSQTLGGPWKTTVNAVWPATTQAQGGQ